LVGCLRVGYSSLEWLAALRFISNDEHTTRRQLFGLGGWLPAAGMFLIGMARCAALYFQ
jgi:hypothetical protein